MARVPEVGDYWIASRRHNKSFLREAVPVYKEALDRYGIEDKWLFLFRDLCVADGTQEAEERVQEAYENIYQVYQRWGQLGERHDQGFDDLKKERLIVGSPEQAVEQVMEYHREFGAEFLSCTVHWPGMAPNVTLETIRQFEERVIPEVERATPVNRLLRMRFRFLERRLETELIAEG